MLGICLRESVCIMLLSPLTTLPFVSTVASPICSRILIVLGMKRRLHTTGKRIWTSALRDLPIIEGGRNGPKVVAVMDKIGAMDLGFN